MIYIYIYIYVSSEADYEKRDIRLKLLLREIDLKLLFYFQSSLSREYNGYEVGVILICNFTDN